MQGHKIYQEKLFTSFRLSDRVPEDNFYRRLDKCLDLSFLFKATSQYYGTEGNTGIDPVVFFKLILTGYFENLQSDRRIIDNAKLRLDILYFIGYDIDEELPWHSTISRTRQLFGEEVFKELFQKVLIQCIDKGMVAGKRQAIDSVLIKANASMDSLQTLNILKDGEEYISNLTEDDNDNKNESMPGKETTNSRRHSLTDPDARIATKPGKPRQMNYLGQLSVDTAHHVITNIEAHHADKRDSECLSQVLNQTIENLRANNLEIKEIIADTNYSSAEALKAAITHKVDAYIPNLGQYKTEREGFTYNAEGDYYQCQRGIKLSFKSLKYSHGYQNKVYRASTNDCKNCPIKASCCGKQKCKIISHSLDKPLYDQMHERMQSTYARKMRRLRQSTAEPVIGTLVNFLAMKRIRTIGIQQANKYMIGAAIAYNIKKWLNWENKKQKTAVIALPIPEKIKNEEVFSTGFQQISFVFEFFKIRLNGYKLFNRNLKISLNYVVVY